MAALAFLRPFERSSAIAFGPVDATQRSVTLAVTLQAPALSIRLQNPAAAVLDAILLAPTPAFVLSRIHSARLDMYAPPPEVVASIAFSADIPVAVTAAALDGWRNGRDMQAAHRYAITGATPLQGVSRMTISAAAACTQGLEEALQPGEPLQGGLLGVFCAAVPVQGDMTPTWQPGEPLQGGLLGVFCAAVPVRDAWRDAFNDGQAVRDSRITMWQGAQPIRVPRADRYADGLYYAAAAVDVWTQAAYPGVWKKPPTPPPDPPGPTFNNDLDFLFPFLLTADLEFVRFGPRRIPLRRTYFVLHEIAITRVSDGAELHFEDLTLSADVGSWGWSLSGNALGDATYARLVASPFTEIDVLINGLHWRFLVTSVSHSRSFGSTGYRVTGVSPALALTAPLSDARSRRVTAPWSMIQLADQEVENTAWAVNWTAPDWLIPGGVWQYSQQTPLQALGSLAEAAGAFVQAERVNRVIQVAPRYPAWPWSDGWLFQSASWPVAILRDLTRSPKPGNNYNAVYAAGTVAGGIMGYVKRAGSAGDIQPGAPITNTLITHVDGARAFGGAYLADHLDQIDVSFSTILGGDAPLIGLASRIDLTEPGQDPQRLLTQAVSISVQRGNNAVTVTQGVKGVVYG